MLETNKQYPSGAQGAPRAQQEERSPTNQAVVTLANAIGELEARIENLHRRLDPVIVAAPTTSQAKETVPDGALCALESALLHLAEQINTQVRRVEVIIGQLRI